MSQKSTIYAAGAVLWRGSGPGLEVALVHRPKYRDWSWPKGKLDPGESFPAAAVREVLEETGARIALGRPLAEAKYPISTPLGIRPKVVKYWAAHCPEEPPAGLSHLDEVDQVRWVPVDQARTQLSYRWDRNQLDHLQAAEQAGDLRTWPLVVVRHARASSRELWAGGGHDPPLPDQLRPLDAEGHARARRLVPLLAAYRPSRVLSSPAIRCRDTIAPYVELAKPDLTPELHTPVILSEEGFAADPGGLSRYLTSIARQPKPTVLCSHRPVLPSLLGWLVANCGDKSVALDIRESRGPGLVKGEVLIAQLAGSAERARVVSVERIHAP